MRHLIIIGGGFAGLWAALGAAAEIDAAKRRDEPRVTLVSRDGYLVLRPRLYQSDPERLRVPLAPSLEPVGVALVEGVATAIDPDKRRITVSGADGPTTMTYDRLVLATGSVVDRPPIPGLADHAWDVDNFAAARAFDRHLAALATRPETPGRDCVAIVGAGITGVELATEMRQRLAVHVGAARAGDARVVLIERAERVCPDLGDAPRPLIEAALDRAGVEVALGCGVARIAADHLLLDDGARIATMTTVIATGLRASPLAGALAVTRDRRGRLPVDGALRVVGVEGVFAAGDIARAHADGDHLALMSCQHALSMGPVAGRNAARDLIGRASVDYRQARYVTCIDLGPAGAVFTRGWERRVEISGAEAKAIKRAIMEQTIYPPIGDRAAILAAVRAETTR